MKDVEYQHEPKVMREASNFNRLHLPSRKRNLRSKLKCYLAKSQHRRPASKGVYLKTKDLFSKKLFDSKKKNICFFKKIQSRN